MKNAFTIQVDQFKYIHFLEARIMNALLIITFILILVLLIWVNRVVLFGSKGTIGESIVSMRLRKLKADEYTVIDNLLLKTGEKTCQIDHVIVSIYGIFVIETKNYKGWIHGNEEAQYWKQTIYEHKSKFYNPIRQNQGHINTLRKTLAEYQIKTVFHSIIVL